MKSGIRQAVELLTGRLRLALENIIQEHPDGITELRLRLRRYASAVFLGRDMYINGSGSLSESPDGGIICTEEDIEYAFKSAFSYSLHSYSRELSSGFITSSGGNRVGLCGTAVTALNKPGEVESVKYISSINIRIAHEITGFGLRLFERCLNGSLCGVIIVGPPASGKTTLLRDVARLLGDKARISLIDELGELSSSVKGIPNHDIGRLTDVFVGYPKHEGIRTAVRAMSPRAVIVDEIGTEEDLHSLEYALHSGVCLVSAVHGEGFKEASKKDCVKRLLELGAFKYAAELTDGYEYRIIRID